MSKNDPKRTLDSESAPFVSFPIDSDPDMEAFDAKLRKIACVKSAPQKKNERNP